MFAQYRLGLNEVESEKTIQMDNDIRTEFVSACKGVGVEGSGLGGSGFLATSFRYLWVEAVVIWVCGFGCRIAMCLGFRGCCMSQQP